MYGLKFKDVILLLVAAILIVVFFLLLRSPEDRWICENGTWVKHGFPSAQRPQSGCSGGQIVDFDSCIAAGYPVMESYPRQCQDSTGNTFIEHIGNELELMDMIRINNPKPNQSITSPLTISGEARGMWFFEASFPVKLVATHGKVLSRGVAQAQGDWMTEAFVPFEAILVFNPGEAESGTLILRKDNPSSLPENEQELIVPVYFAETILTD